MRTRLIKSETITNSYELSISDLMAALCSIFLIFLVVTVLKLNQQKAEYTAKNGIAEAYRSMQSSLYKDLKNEFEENFKEWDLELTPDLTFHFKDKNTLFTPDKSDLQPRFKSILNEFFPKLIHIISSEKYVNEISEIRIEGHTAQNLGQSREEDYRTGMQLSQERTMSVLIYCLQDTKLLEDKINKESALQWIRKRIVAIGFSNSIPVIDEMTQEIDWDKSRRVEIKIKTNAESIITEIQNISRK